MPTAAAWWHGWSRDDWDRLAGAVAAGHIIECGPQAMGGNFSGFTELPPAIRLGFPIAEIASDGSAVITKRADEAGAVTVDTVTAQLLYEIQGTRYLNPDVVLHVDSLRLTQEGPDRVAVTGAIGSPAPDTTKVGCFYPNGHRCVLWAFATGLDVDAKVDWLETQLRSVVETLELDDFRYTPCGQPVADPATLGEATIAIRIAAAAQDPRQLGRLLAGYSSFGLGGIPGFHGEIGGATTSQRVEYWPGVIRQAEIRQRAVLDDGRVIDIELPPTEAFQGQPAADAGAARRPIADEESCRVPLGLLAHARSGDKGGNSNLGVWARRPDAREWLKAFLTADEVHRLLACPEDVTVERFVLDEIGGVLFVLRNYFGASGTGNIGLDQIGKSVGEFLRAKVVDVPARLVNAPRDA
ncbi:MAG: acyclic terpene utilization AtuA family protein [Jiangellaceae bacterium]